MFLNVFMLIFSLAFILFSCFLFTNAVEWLGKRLNLSEGVVGSILSAVGTALPETIIPIIAILFSAGAQSHEIGIGAIAGAPFMLGTLAFFITGLAVLIYSLEGKRSLKMTVDNKVFSRDLIFFICVYGIAVLTTFVSGSMAIKSVVAVILILSYVLYIKRSFSGECSQCEELEALYFTRVFKVAPGLTWIIVQLAISLSGIISGAHLFVKYVENTSSIIGIAPLILSIIITPVATELPEKLNSIIWIGRKKDTLALGNITGAMVFQSSFPVVFGILFTPWHLAGITMLSAVLALISAVINLLWVKISKTVNPFVLMLGGVLYAIFIINVFT